MTIEVSSENTTLQRQNGVVNKVRLFLANHFYLLASLIVLALALIYIHPLFETSISDDWAYIWTAHHLFDTGQYQLHPWSSANIMFQAYWGVLFAYIGGYSIGTLHISTIALAFIGVISLYLLALEHNLSRISAGLVAFCLVANALFLYLTPTFMTDVPALALQILSLLLYSRGLKRQSWIYMLAGGIICGADLYIRPTGLALLAGLGLTFLLDKDRLKNLILYIFGAAFPVGSGLLYVFGNVLTKSNVGMNTVTSNGTGQIKFMTDPGSFIPTELIWRPAIFLIYMAFFSLPLVVAIIFAQFSRKSRERLALNPKVIGIFSLLMMAALVYQVAGLNGSLVFPYFIGDLAIIENVPFLGLLLTLIVIPGGIILGALIWKRIGGWKRWKTLPTEQRLLDTITLIMLLYHLLFFQLIERYLFTLLPFVFIVLARFIQPNWKGLKKFLIGTGLIVIGFTSVSTHFTQANLEAGWKASDYVVAQGVSPLKVFGPWGWYCTYNFSDYTKTNPDLNNVRFMFTTWLPERQQEADYQITFFSQQTWLDKGWQVVKTIPFDTGIFQEWSVFILKRPSS